MFHCSKQHLDVVVCYTGMQTPAQRRNVARSGNEVRGQINRTTSLLTVHKRSYHTQCRKVGGIREAVTHQKPSENGTHIAIASTNLCCHTPNDHATLMQSCYCYLLIFEGKSQGHLPYTSIAPMSSLCKMYGHWLLEKHVHWLYSVTEYTRVLQHINEKTTATYIHSTSVYIS